MSSKPVFHIEKKAPQDHRTNLNGRVGNSRANDAKKNFINPHLQIISIPEVVAWIAIPTLVALLFEFAPSVGFSSQTQYNMIWVLISLCFYAIVTFSYLMLRWHLQDSRTKWNSPQNANDQNMGLGVGLRSRTNTRR